MSATYTITPLDLGSCRREKSFFTYMTDVGTPVDLAVISFLVRSDHHTLLIDTGAPPPDQALSMHLPYEQTEAQTLGRQLERHGVRPSEVDAVIYTHLHWDHMYNAEIVTGARFFTTPTELAYAQDPCPWQAWMYDVPSLGGNPPYLRLEFELSGPDREVIDGLGVIPTPGHSPGHQSVLVATATGPAIVAGDIAPLEDNWKRQIPNGMLHNIEQHYESFQRLKATGAHVIASHDPRTLTRGTYPYAATRPGDASAEAVRWGA